MTWRGQHVRGPTFRALYYMMPMKWCLRQGLALAHFSPQPKPFWPLKLPIRSNKTALTSS